MLIILCTTSFYGHKILTNAIFEFFSRFFYEIKFLIKIYVSIGTQLDISVQKIDILP